MKYAPIEEIIKYFKQEERLPGIIAGIIEDREGLLEELISTTHSERKAKLCGEIQGIETLLQGMYHYTAYGRDKL